MKLARNLDILAGIGDEFTGLSGEKESEFLQHDASSSDEDDDHADAYDADALGPSFKRHKADVG